MISKTEFVRGLDCERRLWLDRFRVDLRPPLGLAVRDRIETGKALGKLARKRYPDGVFVEASYGDPNGAAAKTMSLIEAGAKCIFEATFLTGDHLVRADVLSRTDDGGWILDEVKSSSVKEPDKIDDDKVFDLAFQMLTLEQAGLRIKSARLVLVDTSRAWPGGGYDAEQLFGVVDLTARCVELRQKIEARAKVLTDALGKSDEPDVETNTHCKKCDYFEHCHAKAPKHDVIHFPRVSPKVVRELREKGFDSIEKIPDDYKLTDARRRMRDVILAGRPHIGEGLKEAIAAVPFPAAFIDYESSNPAFPMYPGTRPYQQICFQWSAHVLSNPDSKPVHDEFLPVDLTDPREEFCSTLWRVVEPCASLVHYTGFEITQVRSMVKDGIPLASELLEAIETRSVDLEKIVSEHVYFEEFVGRTSIKVVLPVLVPSMSYKELIIADGTAAACGFRRMLAPETVPDEVASLRRALLEYCCQDTLAMVEIYRALGKLSGV